MDVRQVPRSALDLWLRAVRGPIDLAAKALPNGDAGPRSSVTLFVDRADATVRDLVGKLVGDDTLREEAALRLRAADERVAAIELRAEAEAKSRKADTEFAERQRQADARRAKAEREAEEREQAIDQERAQRKRQVSETVAKQERAVEQVRDNKRQAAAKEAKRERLKVLERETEALDEEADALTAQDEARRLRDAAAKAKNARKRTD